LRHLIFNTMAAQPAKQEGETSFVNYMDASKSYDKARECVGVPVILGAMAASKCGTPLAEQSLLDAGCGTGNYVSEVIHAIGSCVAQDFSEGMLDKARAKFKDEPKVKSIDQGDACKLAYGDASFDAIMNNQVVQHIETDESRPTRANLKSCMEESFRVLKPGGVLVVSTRSKEPHYDHLYWYSVLAPKAVAKMEKRVPSRVEVVAAMEAAGLEVTLCVCPKLKAIMHKEHYYNAKGPFDEAWRRGESWWSLVDEEELKSLQEKLQVKIDDGSVDEWIQERDLLRKAAGQTLFVVGSKPVA